MSLTFEKEKENAVSILERLIHALHNDSPYEAVIACTGAGTGLLDMLWQVPGSSRTLLSFHMPYAQEAMIEFLGYAPESAVSRETAIAMAVRALNQARDLLQKRGMSDDYAIGLGLTAAVATDRSRRGKDHCHIAVACPDGSCWTAYVEMRKNVWSRSEQSSFCAMLALLCLFYAVFGDRDQQCFLLRCELERLWRCTDGVNAVKMPAKSQRDIELFEDASLYMPDGAITHDPNEALNPDTHVLFPGSFNPLSFAHRNIAEKIAEQTGKEVVFHITRSHPDKPAIPDDVFKKILAQFAWHAPVLVTNGDRLFVDKARMFPNFTFGIGVDALKGLLNPKYYGGEWDGVMTCVRELASRGAQFAVFGRLNAETGKFETIEDIEGMPQEMRDICIPITGRWDISSTQLRERVKNTL